MAQAPTILTERLVLVPFGEEHLTPRYVAWLNDPDVVRFSELRHSSHDLASCKAYLRSFGESPHYFWAIMTDHPSAWHIGNITAHVDVSNRLADVGILIGEKQVWGLGYGTEVWGAVCTFLLGGAGLRKVAAGTMASNTGMLYIMKKAGMFEEARRLDHYLRDGQPEDLVYCALFGSNAGPISQ